jgi:hypothetical protein
MKKSVFTICAKNYIGLAQVLERSIIRYNDDIDFFIFVADDFLPSEKKGILLPANLLIAKYCLNISEEKWHEMSFKYDLTEFCTSIKPFCFKHLFETKGYEQSVYLDPDILVFNSMEYIFQELNRFSIILTPHVVKIEEKYSGDLKENGFLSTGVFNLGFLALKRDENSLKMLNWWANRLEDFCYRDVIDNYFTDQKWIDFLPCFFSSEVLLISHHLGLNLAPWNFYERTLVKVSDQYFVHARTDKLDNQNYPLIFAHFSGFDYSMLIGGKIQQGNIQHLLIHEDLSPIFVSYSSEIFNSKFKEFNALGYLYNFFNNGTSISIVHRRLYRRLLHDGKIKSNPFETGAPDSFYYLMVQRKILSKKTSAIDKMTKYNMDGVENKLKWINNLSIFLFKIFGGQRYFLLIKLLRSYSKMENQVHLIDRSYLKNNILEK